MYCSLEDGRAVAVVGRAVGQSDVELRDGAVGKAAVNGEGEWSAI